MAKKINIVESVVSVGFEDAKFQRGMKQLRKQLKDSEKIDKVASRRKAKQQEMESRAVQKADKAKRAELKARRLERRAAESHAMKVSLYRARRKKDAAVERRAKARDLRLETEERRRATKHATFMRRNKLQERLANSRERRAQELHERRMARRQGRTGRAGMGIGGIALGGAAVGGALTAKTAINTAATWEMSMNAMMTQLMSKGMSMPEATKVAQERADLVYSSASYLQADPTQQLQAINEMSTLQNKATGLDFKDIVALTQQLSLSSKALGVDSEQFAKFMYGTRQTLQDVAKGVGDAQNVRQMSENAPLLFDQITRQLGMQGATAVSFADQVRAGKFNINDVVRAVAAVSQANLAGFENYKKRTITGAEDRFQTILTHIEKVFGGEAGKGFKVFLDSVSDALVKNESLFKAAGQSVSEMLASLGGAITEMSEAWAAMPEEEQQAFIENMKQIATVLGALIVGDKLLGLITALTSFAKIIPSGALAATLAALGYAFTIGDDKQATDKLIKDTTGIESDLPKWMFTTEWDDTKAEFGKWWQSKTGSFQGFNAQPSTPISTLGTRYNLPSHLQPSNRTTDNSSKVEVHMNGTKIEGERASKIVEGLNIRRSGSTPYIG